MIYAPVMMATLCRYEHLKKLIESLQKNSYAKHTDLYIAVDYPAKPSHEEGHKKICDYLDSGIEGFNSVNVIKRDRNYGALRNCRDLTEVVFEKHDRMIITEDDNQFSPNFIEFMDKALEKYYHDERVRQICGYSYPIAYKNNTGNTVEINFYNAWGVGMWREKRSDKKATLSYFEKKLRNPFASFRCIRDNLPSYNFIMQSIKNSNETLYGDFRTSAYNSANKFIAIAPRIPMVRNNGFDGSGLHCSAEQDKVFNSRPIDNREFFNLEGMPSVMTRDEKKKINSLFGADRGMKRKAYRFALIYFVLGKKPYLFLMNKKRNMIKRIRRK